MFAKLFSLIGFMAFSFVAATTVMADSKTTAGTAGKASIINISDEEPGEDDGDFEETDDVDVGEED
jgi:hypothetical protein